MDLLIRAHRIGQKYVDLVGVRPFAQKVFRLLLRLRYGSERMVTAQHNGRLWKLVPEVALRGEFAEFETVEWLREVVRPGECVIDVGANVGQMTLEAAYLVGKSGRVIAIEPAPGNVKVLRKHIDSNGFSKSCMIFENACGSADRENIELHIFGKEMDAVGSGHNIRKPVHDGSWIAHRVTMRTLDSICFEERIVPSVIKIDVEGAELDVLLGASNVLQAHKPIIRFAFHPFAFDCPVEATKQIRKLLSDLNYRTPENGDEAYGLMEYIAEPID